MTDTSTASQPDPQVVPFGKPAVKPDAARPRVLAIANQGIAARLEVVAQLGDCGRAVLPAADQSPVEREEVGVEDQITGHCAG